jgi:endoglucanase
MKKQVLKELIEALSPSGFEGEAISVFDKEMEEIGARKYYQDKMGNSGWALGNGPVKVLVSGHVDAISARVQYISDDGVMSLVNVGGMDRKALLGSEVIVLGERGPVHGVIEKVPIHIEYSYDDEKEEVGPFSKLRVDIGAENKDQVLEQGITPGCPVVHARCYDLEFGPNRLRGNELDDKLGVFTTIEAARILKESGFSDKYTLIFLATVGEETGLRGATVATQNINPDVSIDFDTMPATDGDLDIEKDAHGDIKLGKGVVISWGPEKSARLCRALNRVARDNKIEVQNETTSAGGTNTSRFQLFSKDCECALISFPLRSLHTPVETADWRDVEGSIQLLTKIIQDGTIL